VIADWRPGHGLEIARRRAALLARVREWFDAAGVLEVQTPALDTAAVSDPHIESIEARLAGRAAPRYLHTSPEYAMKRLLAAGFPDIYQVCTVFRDGEVGRRHQPEFTMVEWYRHGMTLDAIVDDTVGLVRALLAAAPEAAGEPALRRVRYDEALADACGVRSDSDIAALHDAAGKGFPETLADRRDALLDFLFATRVSATFPDDTLTVVTHYPASQAALARIDPGSGCALRFELFHGDLELANGFVELTNAAEQRERFEADQSQRRTEGLPLRPLDERFLAALKHGLPDCAGVALGFDRVLMRATGAASIEAVISFPHRQDG
jgi:lysyl-tRNA synthetase class 2